MKCIVELAQTADILEGRGPVGVEDDLVSADFEPGVVIVVSLVEELQIAENEDQN